MGRDGSKQQPQQPTGLVSAKLPMQELIAALAEQLPKVDPEKGEILQRTLIQEQQLAEQTNRRIKHGFKFVKATDGSSVLKYIRKTADGKQETLTLCEGKEHLKPNELDPYWKRFFARKELKSLEDFKDMLYCLHTAIYGHEVRDGKLITEDQDLNLAFEMLQDKIVLLDDQRYCAVKFLTITRKNFFNGMVDERVNDCIVLEMQISLLSEISPDRSVKTDYKLYGNPPPPPEPRRHTGGSMDMGWPMC
jgi:hypothetical protein